MFLSFCHFEYATTVSVFNECIVRWKMKGGWRVYSVFITTFLPLNLLPCSLYYELMCFFLSACTIIFYSGFWRNQMLYVFFSILVGIQDCPGIRRNLFFELKKWLTIMKYIKIYKFWYVFHLKKVVHLRLNFVHF